LNPKDRDETETETLYLQDQDKTETLIPQDRDIRFFKTLETETRLRRSTFKTKTRREVPKNVSETASRPRRSRPRLHPCHRLAAVPHGYAIMMIFTTCLCAVELVRHFTASTCTTHTACSCTRGSGSMVCSAPVRRPAWPIADIGAGESLTATITTTSP